MLIAPLNTRVHNSQYNKLPQVPECTMVVISTQVSPVPLDRQPDTPRPLYLLVPRWLIHILRKMAELGLAMPQHLKHLERVHLKNQLRPFQLRQVHSKPGPAKQCVPGKRKRLYLLGRSIEGARNAGATQVRWGLPRFLGVHGGLTQEKNGFHNKSAIRAQWRPGAVCMLTEKTRRSAGKNLLFFLSVLHISPAQTVQPRSRNVRVAHSMTKKHLWF
jgi:hypothetical protein